MKGKGKGNNHPPLTSIDKSIEEKAAETSLKLSREEFSLSLKNALPLFERDECGECERKEPLRDAHHSSAVHLGRV
jgi:hypothetical protein